MMGEVREYLRVLVAAGVIGVGAVRAAWGWQGAGTPAPAQAVEVEGDVAALWSAEAGLAERQAAARRLVGSTGAEARAAVRRALEPGSGGSRPEANDAQALVLAAVAETPSAAPWVLEPLAGLLGSNDLPSERRAAAVRAVGSIRTRDAVRVLIEQATRAREPGGSGTVAEAAIGALVRLTGRSEFGGDLDQWRLWYGGVQWLPEAEWRRELADGLAARADALANQRAGVISRLVDDMRRRYLDVGSLPERSELLAGFLSDPQPEVRRLGLTLAQQELANARQLEPSVADATVALLNDSSPSFRRQAAELLTILAPEGRGAEVVGALRRETDPQVAALLLKAAARSPMAEAAEPAVAWLEDGPATMAAACEALDALDRRGLLGERDGPVAGRVVERLRRQMEQDAGALPPSGLRLLHDFGNEEDRRRVLGLLSDSVAQRRWAAASAAAQIPSALDALVEAAKSDDALFPLAAQAVRAFRPTAGGFMTLAELPAADPAVRRERLLALAAQLPHAELVRAARATEDAALREAMLARLLREPLALLWDRGPGRTFKPDVITGLFMLSETRAELGQPAGALTALDALAPVAGQVDPEELARRRVPLLLWLNRVDEAERMEAPIEAWLNGLERCVALEHAARVVGLIESRFSGKTPPEAAERFEGLKARIGR